MLKEKCGGWGTPEWTFSLWVVPGDGECLTLLSRPVGILLHLSESLEIGNFFF